MDVGFQIVSRVVATTKILLQNLYYNKDACHVLGFALIYLR